MMDVAHSKPQPPLATRTVENTKWLPGGACAEHQRSANACVSWAVDSWRVPAIRTPPNVAGGGTSSFAARQLYESDNAHPGRPGSQPSPWLSAMIGRGREIFTFASGRKNCSGTALIRQEFQTV